MFIDTHLRPQLKDIWGSERYMGIGAGVTICGNALYPSRRAMAHNDLVSFTEGALLARPPIDKIELSDCPITLMLPVLRARHEMSSLV
jgi:hypothetical protein